MHRWFPKENGVVVLRRMESRCQSGINNRCPLHAPVSLIQNILGIVHWSFFPWGPTLYLFSKMIFDHQVYNGFFKSTQRAILNNLYSSSVVSHEQKKQTIQTEPDLARSPRKINLFYAQLMSCCLIIMSYNQMWAVLNVKFLKKISVIFLLEMELTIIFKFSAT